MSCFRYGHLTESQCIQKYLLQVHVLCYVQNNYKYFYYIHSLLLLQHASNYIIIKNSKRNKYVIFLQ